MSISFRKGLIVALFSALASSSHAQSIFGNIVGTVQDQSRAIVPQASVKIRNLDDNSSHSTCRGITARSKF